MMNTGNNSFSNDDEIKYKPDGKKIIQAIKVPDEGLNAGDEFILIEDSEKRNRLLSIILADIKWTLNSKGDISFISPFTDNCIGRNAKTVFKNIASKYLTPASVESCFIELEELMEITRTHKNTKPRKLIIDILPNDNNIEKAEITSTAIFDLEGNVVGISGLCRYLTNNDHLY